MSYYYSEKPTTSITRRHFLALSGLALISGCSKGGLGSTGRFTAWGSAGRRNGQFVQPRGIGVHRGEVYVVDTTGRIQVFDLEGNYLRQWSTLESENGTPTDVAFDLKGNVIIPDTHYSRILEYSPQGELLKQWGEYGTGEQQFIYPTGVAIDKEGNYFISEYGTGAERVHVFDNERRFIRQWGTHGEAPGQFNRAMGISIGPDGNVYVADTTNHRIQCFAPGGEFVRTIGEAGSGPGQIKFPYHADISPDGSVFVCEYGNHRVSRFAADGRFIQTIGSPGRNPGQFNGPRGIACSAGSAVYVADTDNHRVQRIRL